MKREYVRKSLLVLMVSTLVLVTSSNTFAQRGLGKQRFMNDSSMVGRCIPNLTAEQQTKIEGLRVKHLKEITPLKNELDEKRAHLRTLESAEKFDKDAINKTIDEMSVLQGKIMKLSASHRSEIASNLTDEQKVYFNSHRGQHGMGKGMKNRMRNGMGRGMGGSNCPNPNCPNKK